MIETQAFTLEQIPETVPNTIPAMIAQLRDMEIAVRKTRGKNDMVHLDAMASLRRTQSRLIDALVRYWKKRQGEKMDLALQIATLLNTAAPGIANLLVLVKRADGSVTVVSVLDEADATFQADLDQAKAWFASKGKTT